MHLIIIYSLMTNTSKISYIEFIDDLVSQAEESADEIEFHGFPDYPAEYQDKMPKNWNDFRDFYNNLSTNDKKTFGKIMYFAYNMVTASVLEHVDKQKELFPTIEHSEKDYRHRVEKRTNGTWQYAQWD